MVRIKGFISNTIEVPSDVPQRSHQGPLLFIIFVNEYNIINVYYILLFMQMICSFFIYLFHYRSKSF